jgi:hypothetical protein
MRRERGVGPEEDEIADRELITPMRAPTPVLLAGGARDANVQETEDALDVGGTVDPRSVVPPKR